MGGEGSIAAMIVSLRNNKNLRPGRKHFFSRERLNINPEDEKHRSHKKIIRTPEQILEFQIELKRQARKDTLLKTGAFIIALGVATVILYFLYTLLP